MIFHLIDFLVDYFTNLNTKKIFGGIIVLLGLAVISRIGSSGNPDKAVLYAVIGIIIGGIGFVIIYYDIAKDRTGRRYDELRTLTKAYKQNERENGKLSTWHMDSEPTDKTRLEKK